MGYVCSIHQQYVPDDKRCPYCVEPEAHPDGVGISCIPYAASILKDVYRTATIDVTTLAATPGWLWADIVTYCEEAEERNMERIARDLGEILWGKS